MQFTNTVQNTSNTSVIWRVNGVAGGSAAFGTISGSGLYTAPSVVPTVPNITVTAVAAADSSKSADASVTIALPISVSPSSVSVVAAQNVQFTASVTFSTNTGVNWLVNGVTGGNSSTGTIDSNGLYTAPNSVPAPNKVTVTAVSKADGSRNALATVTITPAAIVISPTDALLSAGAQQAYTATVLSSAVKPVWKVMCASTQPGDCGSITSDGTYTAPPGPPLHGVVTIEANLSDGSGSNGNVTATIQFGNATLAGRYVFSTADEVGHAVPSQTGTIVFDGSGNISGGLFDTADKPGAPTSVTGGTYQVGSDGRGTAAVQTTSGPFNLQFALSSHTKGFVVRTDSTANQAAGTLELQQIIPGTSALNGAHVLSVSGFTTSASAVRFAEAGSILTSNTGAITGGSIDLNKNLTLQANSVSAGSFTQPSIDGRGTLTFSSASSTQTFAYYLIDNAHARIVAVDGSDAVGELFRQAQGSVSSLSLRGRYAFLVNGTMNGDPFGVAGVFALDGSTSVTDQLFDGLAQTVFDFNPGSYSVTDPTTGRTTATWTANSGTKIQYVMYPRSDGGLAMLESDGLYQASGVALPQTSSVGNFLVTQGGFALHLRGSSFATPLIAERYTGQIRYSSSSALVATVDGASVSQGSAFTLNLTNLNTTRQRYVFGTASDVATLAGKVTIMYRINDDEVFAIESNENRTLTGILQRQF
ncbi:MAG: hypothetical protein JWO13_477 [Acidobacteriales bacterium]|nr:hypothetical protein [Terriglobales bacterium]